MSPDVAPRSAPACAAAGPQQDAATGGAEAANGVLMPVAAGGPGLVRHRPKVLKQLEPFVELLPLPPGQPGDHHHQRQHRARRGADGRLPGITRAQAQQIILRAPDQPFAIRPTASGRRWARRATGLAKPQNGDPASIQVDVKSHHFEVYGQLRYEQHVIRERSVV